MWTKKKKMILNKKKNKEHDLQFLQEKKFTTRLIEDNENIEVTNKMKLLGTIITDDLKWEANTSYIVKRAWTRMQLLHTAAKFTKERNDLKSIFITYIRPILEQSLVVWHSSLTCENSADLERVQKGAIRLIMGTKFDNYEKSLDLLRMKKLSERRTILSLTFAKRTLTNKKNATYVPKKDRKSKWEKKKNRNI